MQTFLPYADFKETAAILDNKRLGKQRIEAMQILQILTGLNKTDAWANHPAVKMWKGYEVALAQYAFAICDEWTQKGYKDSCKSKIQEILKNHYDKKSIVFPKWLGNKSFHDSHKSNLLRKKNEWYSKTFKDIPNNLKYVWPTNDKI